MARNMVCNTYVTEQLAIDGQRPAQLVIPNEPHENEFTDAADDATSFFDDTPAVNYPAGYDQKDDDGWYWDFDDEHIRVDGMPLSVYLEQQRLAMSVAPSPTAPPPPSAADLLPVRAPKHHREHWGWATVDYLREKRTKWGSGIGNYVAEIVRKHRRRERRVLQQVHG